MIFKLAHEGEGDSGRKWVKSIAKQLNERKFYTLTGGRWGVGTVHRIPTRRTYISEHEWGKTYKDGTPNAAVEVVTVPMPPIADRETFDAVQKLLKKRAPMVTPGRTVSGPTLLTGICFCADCGGAMTLRTSGKAKHYRYYTCTTAARQGKTGCTCRTIQMDRLDHLVADYIWSTGCSTRTRCRTCLPRISTAVKTGADAAEHRRMNSPNGQWKKNNT